MIGKMLSDVTCDWVRILADVSDTENHGAPNAYVALINVAGAFHVVKGIKVGKHWHDTGMPNLEIVEHHVCDEAFNDAISLAITHKLGESWMRTEKLRQIEADGLATRFCIIDRVGERTWQVDVMLFESASAILSAVERIRHAREFKEYPKTFMVGYDLSARFLELKDAGVKAGEAVAA